MKPDKTTMDNLLRQFMTVDEARRAAEDIEAGDRLFSEHLAQGLSEEALERIQHRVRTRLRHRRQLRRWLEWSAAAAVVVVALSSGLRQAHRLPPPDNCPMPASRMAASQNGLNIWKALASYDLELKTIDNELSDVAGSLDTIKAERFGSAGSQAIILMELEEIEMMASCTDFWKG